MHPEYHLALVFFFFMTCLYNVNNLAIGCSLLLIFVGIMPWKKNWIRALIEYF